MGGPILSDLLDQAGKALEEKGLTAVYDNWIKRSSRTVEDNIPGFGQVLTGSLRFFKEKYAQEYGSYAAQEDSLLRAAAHDKDVIKNYYDYFTGAKQSSNPAVRDLANFHKTKNLEEYLKAGKSGVPIGPPNPDNFSRKWAPGMLQGKNRDAIIKHLVDTRQAGSLHEAEKLLDIMAERSKGRKSFNLRIGRKVDAPGWRKDIYSQQDAMRGKIYDRVYTQTFGDGGKKLNDILSAIRKNNGHAAWQLANRYVDVMLRKPGQNYVPYSNLEKTVNSVLTARYLGAISIRHAGQSLNSLLFGGRMMPMVKALSDVVSNYEDARAYGLRSGALTTSSLEEIKRLIEENTAPEHTLASKIFEITGFPKLMRMNRVITAKYGQYLAEDLVDEYKNKPTSYVARKLAQLGIDADKAAQDGLSLEDLYRASSRTTEVTMSPMEPENLPLAWRDNPLHRWMSQYKPFIYMQSTLLKEHVLKPAFEFLRTGGSSGDIRPLAYLALTFPTAGEIIGDAYNLVTRGNLKSRPSVHNWADRLVDNIGWLGGLGMLNDLVYMMTSSEGTNLFGPLEGEMSDLVAIIKSKHPGKQAMKQVPIVGRLISKQMAPKGSPKPAGMEGWLYEGHITKELQKILGENY